MPSRRSRRDKPHVARQRTLLVIPALVMLVGSVLSIQAGQRRADSAAEARGQALSVDLTARMHNAEMTMARLGDLVVGAAAHFSRWGSGDILDADLVDYLAVVQAESLNPDMRTGLTYIARVESDEGRAFIRHRNAIDPDFPADTVIPPGQQAVVAAQSEPLGHKGVSLSAELIREEALLAAATTGVPMMTAPVMMPYGQAIGVHVFSPITSGPEHETVGWIGTVVDIGTLRHSIVDATPDAPPLAVFDGPHVVLTNASEEIERTAALASSSILGREWLIAADEPPSPSGLPDWVLVMGAGLALSLSAAIVSLLVISDRRRLSEEVTEASQQRDQVSTFLTATFDDGPVGMAVIGLLGDERGRFIRVNDPFARFVDRSAEDMPGLSCADVVPADELTNVQLILDAFSQGEGSDRAEERQWRRADGTVVWGLTTCSVLTDRLGHPAYVVAQVQDIDDRRHMALELRRQHAFMEAVLSNIEVGILACDADARITFYNAKLAVDHAVLDAPGALLAGGLRDLVVLQPDGIPYDPDDLPLERALRGEDVEAVEIRFQASDGTVRTHLTTAQQMLDVDGSVLGAVAAVHDITDRKRDELALNKLAMTDYLTGLPNRLLLADRLDTTLSKTEDNKGLALLFLDLDRFKLVNDSRGHDIGDRLLRTVAQRITRILRPGDIAARMGGDEFVVLAEGVSGEIEALGVADRLRQAVERSMRIGNDEIVITCSVGVVLAGPDDTAEGLLRHADLAMYRAKDDGRATVRVYEPGLGVAVARRFLMEGQLREALRNNDLSVVYQPIVDADNSDTLAVEALVRWQHDDRLLCPAEFLDVAEDSGLIVDIDRHVMEIACTAVQAGPADLSVSVNLSSRQLANPDLVSWVSDTLDACGLEPSRLCLELTETALINSATSVDASLQALRAMGICLALDDFGTGYASLNYLRRFPVDVIKIDLSFVRDMVHSAQDRAIVSATIDLARDMGLATVAEGVETVEQAEMLTAMGCNRLQGYLFSRPLPAPEVRALGGLAQPYQV